MNRDELKELALIKLEDARVLLENERYDGAYYLCGYVVECGLKACIAKQTKQYDFPDRNIINQSWTHDLTKLVKTAGLESDLDDRMKKDKEFGQNWGVAKGWKEDSRYRKHTEAQARDLYSAIIDKEHGVLQWIEQHW